MMRRLTLVLALACAALLVLAPAASAHVDIDPTEAVAGTTATVTFSFHHGKDGTATTGLEVKLPEGAVLVEVPPVEGWTSSHDEAEGVVTWTGGSVPDGVEAAFPIVVQLPPAPGEVLFPTVQITEAGELAWIDQEGGEGEDSSPAPRIVLAADPNAPATTSTTEAPEETTTTVAASTTTNDLPGTMLEAESRGDSDDSLAPVVIGSGIVALLAIGIGGTILKRRMG